MTNIRYLMYMFPSRMPDSAMVGILVVNKEQDHKEPDHNSLKDLDLNAII